MTTLNGTTSNDNLFGSNGEDFIAGNSGDDKLIGGYRDDSLNGDSGDDLLNGGYHDDSLNGDSGDDLLNGGYHDDSLNGDSGDDLLLGGNHDDVLDGGSGNDTLNGGIGEDTLTGGDGSDRFIFNSLDSLDTITDFDSSQGDRIVFDTAATGVANVSDLTVSVGSRYNHSSELDRVTSIYVDGEKIIEFDNLVTLQIEDFEFI